MAEISLRKKIWGWFFFDWASQPYNTLLLTFIFGPYMVSLIGDGAEAQALWAWYIGVAGIIIAIMAPILGAIADSAGNRVRWVWLFSLMYVVGSAGLWFAAPESANLTMVMIFFIIGLIGMEFATIFTNSMLPDLGPREEVGRISGNGWAFGYIGGLITLVIMLLFFAEQGNGKTLIGIDPIFGFDAQQREGTRFVGPLTAIWFALGMIPFFLWVKDPKSTNVSSVKITQAIRGLGGTIVGLRSQGSLLAYLLSSMFYRDALNGIYVFGGIYAKGVLGWSVVDTGIFGILAIITGAIFAWVGGRADEKFGPKPVISICVLGLTAAVILAVFIDRDSVMGIVVDETSRLPDIAFYLVGALIGAAGGALQSASRTMMVRQANPDRMTEAFGLYALSGKATSFIAPFLIYYFTETYGNQAIGIAPLIALFLIGLILLKWVKPDGEQYP